MVPAGSCGRRCGWEVRDPEGCWREARRGCYEGGNASAPARLATTGGVLSRTQARVRLRPSSQSRDPSIAPGHRDAEPMRFPAERRHGAGLGCIAPSCLPPPSRGCAVRAVAAGGAGTLYPRDRGANQGSVLAVAARLRPGTERCGRGDAALPREPAVPSPRPMGIESFCSVDAYEPFWVSGGMGLRGLGWAAVAASAGTDGWWGAGWDRDGRWPRAEPEEAASGGGRAGASHAGAHRRQSAGVCGVPWPCTSPFSPSGACVIRRREPASGLRGGAGPWLGTRGSLTVFGVPAPESQWDPVCLVCGVSGSEIKCL